MKLSWLGHSSFKLEESTGTTIVTDPYHSYVGYAMPQVSADVVTVSHQHNDHSYIKAVNGNPTIITTPGVYEIGGVHIIAARTFHDDSKGAERGENIAFKFRMDGVDVCHLGDIGEECSVMFVERMAPVNILMIPVGGTYTIDAKQAREYVDRMMPDIVIPMHFKTKDCELDLAKLNDFLELFDDEDVIYSSEKSVEFDRADFDGEHTKVLVLDKFSN